MIKFFRSRQKTHTWQIGFHYRYTTFFSCPVSSPVFFSRKQKCKKTHTSFIENGVCESLLTKIQHLKEIVTKNKFFFRQHKYLKELRFVKCDMKAAKLIKKKSTSTTTTATTMKRGRTNERT